VTFFFGQSYCSIQQKRAHVPRSVVRTHKKVLDIRAALELGGQGMVVWHLPLKDHVSDRDILVPCDQIDYIARLLLDETLSVFLRVRPVEGDMPFDERDLLGRKWSYVG
jgi:hypothetical protein